MFFSHILKPDRIADADSAGKVDGEAYFGTTAYGLFQYFIHLICGYRSIEEFCADAIGCLYLPRDNINGFRWRCVINGSSITGCGHTEHKN
jgi:hypothetical protein